MFDQNPDLDQFLFFGTGQASRSGFWSNIDDFLELYWKNKNENRKSGSKKFLEIPKAVPNRSKHTLKVPVLSALDGGNGTSVFYGFGASHQECPVLE